MLCLPDVFNFGILTTNPFRRFYMYLLRRIIPMDSKGFHIIIFRFIIQLFFTPFGFPFFKLFCRFFLVKKLLNSGEQRSCERINFIIGNTRSVLALSFHSVDNKPKKYASASFASICRYFDSLFNHIKDMV